MDVGCMQGFGASTMTLQHHLEFTVPLISQKSTPTCTLHRWNSVRVLPCSQHPQHIKVLNHFCIYMIWMWDACKVLEPQP